MEKGVFLGVYQISVFQLCITRARTALPHIYTKRYAEVMGSTCYRFARDAYRFRYASRISEKTLKSLHNSSRVRARGEHDTQTLLPRALGKVN